MSKFQILRPTTDRLGPIPVRRLLPARERLMVGPFIFMDHGGPTQVPKEFANGVPEHPHAGLSTFTYLLAGTVLHRDSAGHFGRIEAGDIALMTAGSGITHEERPDREDPSPYRTASFIQMWLALPDEFEEVPPDFEHHRADTLPRLETEGARASVLIGSAWGLSAPIQTYGDAVFVDIECARSSSINLPKEVDELAIYLLEGQASINDVPIEEHALAVAQGEEPLTLFSEGGCRAIILGGARFGSERFLGGSFVASSPEKLNALQHAYRSGSFPRIEREKPDLKSH
ncbi:MAG: pirin family protein [Pseudomonadota bacterium]